VALAMLAALPLAATGVSGALAAPAAGSVMSKIDAGQPLINVGRRGGGGHEHGGHGGHGGHGHHGGGGHWHGGGGHWHGGHGHHHHGHHYFRPGFYPGWYGVPYYYDYGSSYYDYYEDDDDAVVYSDSGDAVARCEARYRSFDRRSGTFLSTNGTRKLCPYLR
jgi:hypothetical protein